ncbi:MAG: hypothetical protein JXA24_03685, partial [Proteobacteria bacterium]|nr:hypothetical protein [Pseudomonadota bacterium]
GSELDVFLSSASNSRNQPIFSLPHTLRSKRPFDAAAKRSFPPGNSQKRNGADLTDRVRVSFAAWLEEAGFSSPIINRPTKAPDETAYESRRDSEKDTRTLSVRRVGKSR